MDAYFQSARTRVENGHTERELNKKTPLTEVLLNLIFIENAHAHNIFSKSISTAIVYLWNFAVRKFTLFSKGKTN